MGSRSRKRKKLRELDAMSPLQRQEELSAFRAAQFRAKETRTAVKPEWVRKLESSGHQYIKGGKPGTSPRGLTNAERRENRRTWKAREAKPATRDEGTGRTMRDREYVAIAGDYGHMIGGDRMTVSDDHYATMAGQARYRAHADRMRGRNDAVAYDDSGNVVSTHEGRHMHSSACTVDSECLRNRYANDVPDEANAVQARSYDRSEDERAQRAASRRETVMASRKRTYARGAGASTPSHDMDERGNAL